MPVEKACRQKRRLLESRAARGNTAPMSSPAMAPATAENTEKSAIQNISIKQLYIFLWKLTIATILLVLPFVVLAAVIDIVKSR